MIFFFFEIWLILHCEINFFPMTCQQELISLHSFYCNNNPAFHKILKGILRAVTNCGFAPLRIFQNPTAKPALFNNFTQSRKVFPFESLRLCAFVVKKADLLNSL